LAKPVVATITPTLGDPLTNLVPKDKLATWRVGNDDPAIRRLGRRCIENPDLVACRARAPIADQIALRPTRRVAGDSTARFGEAGDATVVGIIRSCNGDGGGCYDLDDAKPVVRTDEI